MKQLLGVILCGTVASSIVLASGPSQVAETHWAQWRGPDATGVAPHANPPIEWSEEKNVRWKVEVPGKGLAVPIVWGDLVYIQTAIKTDQVVAGDKVETAKAETDKVQTAEAGTEKADTPKREEKKSEGATETEMKASSAEQARPSGPPSLWDRPALARRRARGESPGDGERRGRRGRGGFFRNRPVMTNIHRFVIMAFDRRTGKTVWEYTVREEVPHEGSHPDGSLASASPVTDGEHLFAYFGSRGLYAFDMQGKLLWEKDFGDMKIRMGFGEGSSPVLHGDTIVINWDHEGDSFIVALDKATGEQRWKVDRDEQTTWSTPIVVEDNGKPQVVVSGSKRIRVYDLATGELIWECGGMTANTIPTLVSGNGLVYAMSGYRGSSVQAIRFGGAKGDITDTDAIVWKYDKGTPYVPSPLLYGDFLYFLDNSKAILSCFNAKTGEQHYSRQRLKGVNGIYASPVGAGDRVYLVGRDGKTTVIKHGAEFKVLAVNRLDDDFAASPAIADTELYLRGDKYLYCLAQD